MTTWGRRWTPESAEALRRRRTGAGAPDAAQRASREPTRTVTAPFPGWPNSQLEVAAQPTAPSKYGAIATHVDGHRFPSKLEARLYTRLCVLQAEGRVLAFLRQVPLHLPGGKLVVDFLVQTHSPTRPVRILDAKGVLTPEAAFKIRTAEAHYPWLIELVKGRLADSWEPESEPQVTATRPGARARAKRGAV